MRFIVFFLCAAGVELAALAAVELRPITLPPPANAGYSGGILRVRSFAASRDLCDHTDPTCGDRLFMVLADSVTSGAIAYYSLSTGVSTYVAGNMSHAGVCHGNASLIPGGWQDTPDPRPQDFTLSRPTVLLSARSDQVIVANGMPGANVFAMHQRPPYRSGSANDAFNVSRLMGTHCDFEQRDEASMFADASTALTTASTAARRDAARSLQLPPIEALEMTPLGDLIIAFRRSVGLLDRATGEFRRLLGDLSPPPPPPPPIGNHSVMATRPPLPTDAARLAAVSADITALAMIGETLFVADAGYGAIRSVDLSTPGSPVVTVVSGPAGDHQWSPAWDCLSSPEGCPANNFTAFGVRHLCPFGSQTIFFSSVTFSSVFRLDLQSGRVHFVAGRLPEDTVSGTGVLNPLSGLRHMTVVRPNSSDAVLFLGTSSETFVVQANASASFVPLPSASAAPVLCGVWSSCSGHAFSVAGTPAFGCTCQCQPGWTGERCERRVRPQPTFSKTPSKTQSKSISSALPLPVPFVDRAVEQVATTTVIVTTTIGGVVSNPTIATQGGRAQVLLQLSICDDNLGEPLAFAESPFGLSVGTSPLQYAAGAVTANVGALVGFTVIHYIFVLAVKTAKQLTDNEAHGLLRFPSVSIFPLLFTVEGTSLSSVMLLRHASADITLRLLGVAGLLSMVAILIAVTLFMTMFFVSEYDLYAPAANASVATGDEALSTTASLWRKFRFAWRWLLDVKGKWRDSASQQHRRFGGLFGDYRPGMQAFVLAELGMAMSTGGLAGLKSLHCRAVIVTIMLIYVGFFLLVALLSPADNRYTRIMMTLVSGLQAASGVLVLSADISGSSAVGDWAENVLLTSMFIVGIMSFIDAGARLYLLVKFSVSAAARRARRSNGAVANATFIDGDGDEPLMPLAPALRRAVPSNEASSNNRSVVAGALLDRPPAVSFAVDGVRHTRMPSSQGTQAPMSPSGHAFDNFSFAAENGYVPPRHPNEHNRDPLSDHSTHHSRSHSRTQSPAPSTAAGSASGVRVAQNQTLEQLRLELDDLLAGRASRTTRLDELLDAARRESSSFSGSTPNSGGTQGSSSHRASNQSLTRSDLTAQHTTTGNPSFASPARLGHRFPSRQPSNRSIASLADAIARQGSSDVLAGSTPGTANNSIVRRRPGGGGTRGAPREVDQSAYSLL